MKRNMILTCLVCGMLFSMGFAPGSFTAAEKTAAWYDDCLDTLILQLSRLEQQVQKGAAPRSIKQDFFACREHYKKIGFFVEQFDTRGARLLNGPDLLRIEDDTQSDTTFPHGFQHIEAILFDNTIDRAELRKEIGIQLESVRSLRQAPDHRFYFRNDRIWEALRSGTFRIISMGITGFDVPLSLHALPETEIQLLAMRYIVELYHEELNTIGCQQEYDQAISTYNAALHFLSGKKDFNDFDRLTFIRNYINPLSSILATLSSKAGYIRSDQLSPLNPLAQSLFAPDIFNIDFFSPNERYRMTPERIALGKRLFSDTRLSVNNSRSCASCHKPELAFTDGLARPLHIDGHSLLPRNTPTLWNSALQTRQFYDSRALVLETQLDAVVHSKEEMGGSLSAMVPVLQKDIPYREAFAVAYRNDREPINQYNIANAIASYIRTLTGFNSRFDRYIRGAQDSLSASEKNGFNLFMGKAKCGTCHYAPVFNGLVPPLYEETESEILAVPSTTGARVKLDEDKGKFLHTKVPLHQYAFKTPTVRNIGLTAPYMHNGVFSTLEEVIDFYDNGGGAGSGIHLATQTLPADHLKLSRKEKNDLVAFLNTLTDTTQPTLIKP